MIEEVAYFSNYANLIPWTLIAGLGHDIGKTPELRSLHPHTVDDHQKTSVRKLFELLSGKGGGIMARIKIKDLPKDQKVSKEELKKIFGGDSTILPIDPIAFNKYTVMPTWRTY